MKIFAKVGNKLLGKPVLFFLFTFVVVLIGLQIIFSNQLASKSQRLTKILAEIEGLERDNRDLNVQIYQKGSILQLKEQAGSLGFIEPTKFFFVKQSFLVAENLR